MLNQSFPLDAVIKASPGPLIVTDLDGFICGWSPGAQQLLGWTEHEALGQRVDELVFPSPLAVAHALGVASSQHHQSRFDIGVSTERSAVRKDGSRLVVDLESTLLTNDEVSLLVIFVRDLTERREAQQKLDDLQSRLLHVSRASAMGTMAATLAHELNQPLTAAKSYLAAMSRLLNRTDPAARELVLEGLAGAREAIAHAGDTIRSVRLMVDKRQPALRRESLKMIVNGACRLLRQNLRQIRLVVSIADDADQVMCGRVQVEQVLINLIRNAAEALEGTSGKTVGISAVRSGDTVEVAVRDDGAGVSEELSEALFTPFNSSKPNGLGMGLSICRTMIEQHGGRIWLRQEELGTTILFTLKAAGPLAEAA